MALWDIVPERPATAVPPVEAPVFLAESASIEEVDDSEEDPAHAGPSHVETLLSALQAAVAAEGRQTRSKAKGKGGGKQVRFDGVELPAVPRELKEKADRAAAAASAAVSAATAVATRAAVAPVPGSATVTRTVVVPLPRDESLLPRPAAPAVPDAPAVPPKDRKRTDSGPVPQYKYVTEAEAPELVKSVQERMLDATLTITPRELLAVSQDIRRGVKDMTTTRRVTAGAEGLAKGSAAGPAPTMQVVTGATVTYADAFYAGGPHQHHHRTTETGLLASMDSLALRSVDAVVGGKLEVECVLDQGAAFVAIRRDVVEALGGVVRTDQVIVMTAANSTQDETQGRLPDVPFKFGGLTVYVQAHVVLNAPFRVLLGRPFFAHCKALTQDEVDGSQHLTLTDPNTGYRFGMATRERTERSFLSDFPSPQDF